MKLKNEIERALELHNFQTFKELYEQLKKENELFSLYDTVEEYSSFFAHMFKFDDLKFLIEVYNDFSENKQGFSETFKNSHFHLAFDEASHFELLDGIRFLYSLGVRPNKDKLKERQVFIIEIVEKKWIESNGGV